MKRIRIVDLFAQKPIGEKVNVKGWVRTKRGNKQVAFIALNDGTTIKNIQVVVDLASADEEQMKLISTGACLSVISLFSISLQWKITDQKPYYYLFMLFMCDWQDLPLTI